MTVSLTAGVTAVGVLAEVSRVAMVMGEGGGDDGGCGEVEGGCGEPEMAMEAAEVVWRR